MKIARGKLAEIVAEEVRRRIRELYEAQNDDSDDEDGEGGDHPRKPSTASADTEPPRKGPTRSGPKADTGSPDASSPEVDQDADPGGPAVDGDQPDPEAEASDDEEDAVDADGDAGEEPTGAVNDELSGKTVQAITVEPKSKVLPGSKEVVMTFNESTDALRILITPTGMVKFFYRGQLYDLP